jgi:hypothetical protein
MRGSTFLAVFMILAGLMLLIAALRGRAIPLIEALTAEDLSAQAGKKVK